AILEHASGNFRRHSSASRDRYEKIRGRDGPHAHKVLGPHPHDFSDFPIHSERVADDTRIAVHARSPKPFAQDYRRHPAGSIRFEIKEATQHRFGVQRLEILGRYQLSEYALPPWLVVLPFQRDIERDRAEQSGSTLCNVGSFTDAL